MGLALYPPSTVRGVASRSTSLHVRETKFRKSRLVPLHPTTADALRQYVAQRERLGQAEP